MPRTPRVRTFVPLRTRMRAARIGRALLAALALLPLASARAESPAAGAAARPAHPDAQPKVEDLGEERYRIGLIEVDKGAGSFRVPGAILRKEPPLEFGAVTTGGHKSYESLIEIGATAYEFNLACILIGLDPANARPAQYHFGKDPVEGDAVEIEVAWDAEGGRKKVDLADLIELGDSTLSRGEWIYTGSVFTPDGQYLAQLDGTLVGFVHDPSSIIEHRTGILGSFGDVRPAAATPAVGQRVELRVKRAAKRGN